MEAATGTITIGQAAFYLFGIMAITATLVVSVMKIKQRKVTMPGKPMHEAVGELKQKADDTNKRLDKYSEKYKLLSGKVEAVECDVSEVKGDIKTLLHDTGQIHGKIDTMTSIIKKDRKDKEDSRPLNEEIEKLKESNEKVTTSITELIKSIIGKNNGKKNNKR